MKPTKTIIAFGETLDFYYSSTGGLPDEAEKGGLVVNATSEWLHWQGLWIECYPYRVHHWPRLIERMKDKQELIDLLNQMYQSTQENSQSLFK